MNKKFKVFKKGNYNFKHFIIENKLIKDTSMAILAEEYNPNNLGFGFFKMDNKNDSIDITFPSDEVIIILEGKYNAKIGEESIELKKGDTFYVKKGLKVIFSTSSYVELFFVNYPI